MVNLDSHQGKPTHALLCKFSCLDDWFITGNCSELKLEFKKFNVIVLFFARKFSLNSFTLVE